MPLENPTYVEDLNASNPSYQDFRSEGDDHLRGIKAALKNTFPGMAGRAWRKRNVSASGTITRTDNMSLINAASGITLTPDPASSLGNGFLFMVRAPSTGSVTVNPGEPINGADSYTIPANYTAIITSDGTEFFLMLVFNDVPPTVPAFPSGTKMIFHQTTAPTAWTKIVSSVYNDAALRSTTGTVGTGGVNAFTTALGTGQNTGGHALTIAEMPPHNHPEQGGDANIGTAQGGCCQPSYGPSSLTTGTTGGGGSHTHPLNIQVKYVDVIVASKD